MGIRIAINLKPNEIQDTIKEVSPTIMCSVPRFWEKVYTAVQEKISSAKGIQCVLMNKALKVGRHRNLDYARLGKKAPLAWNCNIVFSIKWFLAVCGRQ